MKSKRLEFFWFWLRHPQMVYAIPTRVCQGVRILRLWQALISSVSRHPGIQSPPKESIHLWQAKPSTERPG